ncbi:MAG TPA: DUF3857 domain-containing transglutaminase family protein [Gammaproteobacteria bacterium]|nr:DUF3857 domain-containing transglutaminase family protein [Gammaproteobacteria bacterium]
MKDWLFRLITLLATCLLACGSAGAAKQTVPPPVETAPPPAWVAPLRAEIGSTVPQAEISQGVYHLLVDTQVRADQRADPEFFFHYAQHIVNQTGVEQSAQIYIDFDPAYETLVLHEVAIWRDGRKLDKLQTARMSLLNREKDLDELLYNGEKSLHLILDDIGVGDTLDYSYSIKGYNPIFENIFAFAHYMEWSVPVRRLSIAVNWLKPQPLYHRLKGAGFKVKEAAIAGGTRYSVEKTDVKGLLRDENTPYWFDPYGVVRFSETKSWREVADWARPLMEASVSDGAEIARIAAGIAKDAAGPEQRIARALQYVQNQVRYFGIEIGENSHRPSKAEETLARRYGDCKDKTVLLLSILRALGIEAYAALVNSRMNRELKEVLPGISMFDHVIVNALYNGKTYWLDPTLQYQSGSLGAIHQPDYGYALVLKPGAAELTDARPLAQAPSGTEIKDSFDLTAGAGKPAVYTAHTRTFGRNAERLRSDLADSGVHGVQNDYLNFYKQYYPSIAALEPARFTDRPDSNEIEVNEKYFIDSMWEESAEEKRLYAWFYANSISPHLQKLKGGRRKQPLELDYPVNVRHSIEVALPDSSWNFNDEDFAENNDFFSFTSRTRFDKAARKLRFEYTYSSKTDFVPADDIDAYIKAYTRTDEQSRYGIYTDTASAGAGGNTHRGGDAKRGDIAEPDYALPLLIVYALLYATVFAAWRVHQAGRPFKGEMSWFPVTLPKFALMWIGTFGLYGLYWFYRNWLYVKQRDRSSIMPAARSLFANFWYYPLYEELRRDDAQRFTRSQLPPPAVAALYAALFLVAAAAACLSDYTIASSLAALALLLPLANYIQFINQDNAPALAHNSKWSPRHFLLLLLSTPLLLLLAGAEAGLLPSESVIPGNKLLHFNLKFLQRKGVVRPEDEIRYFYSDALLSMREDGSGFSDRHVFSYWVDEGRFFLESASYDEIKDLKVTWGGWNSPTAVEVIRKDDSRFTLYAATSGRKDKLFVDTLLERWKKMASGETAETITGTKP